MIESEFLLTIAIPSYNRHQQLSDTLNRLLPQLNDKCFLIIIDNCSIVPVVERTKSIFNRFPDINYKIFRNDVNIGADSNIMRCFEYCSTYWLWTLGDDDEIKDNAISTIFNDIAQHPDMLYINYSSPSIERPNRDSITYSNNISEFLKNIDTIGGLMYISCNVYAVKKLDNVLYQANHNTYSCAAQLIVLIHALLSKDHFTILSNKVICVNPVVPTMISPTALSVPFGLSTFLDIPLPRPERKILVKKLKIDASRWFTIEGAVKAILLLYSKNKKIDVLFLFRKIYNSTYRYFGFITFLKYIVFSFGLLISPNLMLRLLKIYFKNFRDMEIRQE